MIEDEGTGLGNPARRRALAGAVIFALAPHAVRAQAEPEVPALQAFVGGRPTRTGQLTLEIPRIADNGNTVPMKLLFPGGEVKSIHLFSEKNPVSQMAVFHFPEPMPRIEIESRVRLAGTQRVGAVATLADGTLHVAFADCVVTLSACIDGS